MKCFLSLLIISLAFGVSGFAQAGGSTSEIRSRVTDPNGAVVRGATVTVTDAERGSSRTGMTDEEGEYRYLSTCRSTATCSTD